LDFLCSVWAGNFLASVVDEGSCGGENSNEESENNDDTGWEGSLLGGGSGFFLWFFLEINKGVQSHWCWSNAASFVGIWFGSIFAVSASSEPCDDLVVVTLV
jgi:hypothetical protein